ncbi:hypothetical protein QAD02_006494 [Eretmocerus hayati]|uniref:Uncharacterized protein n=1 Tax=Eretmocerus hayati TaxID=131215 RepID=A0ACC2N154_9HYME|nr:hypothetical protein QAD02_006494 [Eretmocerus hayati]
MRMKNGHFFGLSNVTSVENVTMDFLKGKLRISGVLQYDKLRGNFNYTATSALESFKDHGTIDYIFRNVTVSVTSYFRFEAKRLFNPHAKLLGIGSIEFIRISKQGYNYTTTYENLQELDYRDGITNGLEAIMNKLMKVSVKRMNKNSVLSNAAVDQLSHYNLLNTCDDSLTNKTTSEANTHCHFFMSRKDETGN